MSFLMSCLSLAIGFLLLCGKSYGATAALPLPAAKSASGTPNEAPPEAALPAENENGFYISDGSAVSVKDKGITITPPVDWEYSLTYPDSTMLMQVPEQPDAQYRRTIQITSFAGAFYFTEADIADFEKKLVDRFSSGDSSIANFRVRNHMPVDLDGGVKAHLFYTDFTIGDAELMQMHVLVSSENRHFLSTYTDLAAYFDVDAAPAPHLNEAWEVMNSIKLETVAASPMASAFQFFMVGGLAALLFLGFTLMRNRLKAQEYKVYADDKVIAGKSATGAAYSAMPESIPPMSLSAVRLQQEETPPITGADELEFNDKKVKKAG